MTNLFRSKRNPRPLSPAQGEYILWHVLEHLQEPEAIQAVRRLLNSFYTPKGMCDGADLHGAYLNGGRG